MNLVNCECGKVFSADQVAGDAPPRADGVYAVGLTCPHCRAFYHSYYETTDLRKMREAITEIGKLAHRSKKYRRLHTTTLDNYSRQFDALQSRMAEVREVV